MSSTRQDVVTVDDVYIWFDTFEERINHFVGAVFFETAEEADEEWKKWLAKFQNELTESNQTVVAESVIRWLADDISVTPGISEFINRLLNFLVSLSKLQPISDHDRNHNSDQAGALQQMAAQNKMLERIRDAKSKLMTLSALVDTEIHWNHAPDTGTVSNTPIGRYLIEAIKHYSILLNEHKNRNFNYNDNPSYMDELREHEGGAKLAYADAHASIGSLPDIQQKRWQKKIESAERGRIESMNSLKYNENKSKYREALPEWLCFHTEGSRRDNWYFDQLNEWIAFVNMQNPMNGSTIEPPAHTDLLIHKIEQYLPKLRAAIKKKGKKAKSEVIISEAGTQNDFSQRILRILEWNGEYEGFARKPRTSTV